MAGLLTNLFDPGDESSGQTSSSRDYEAGADGGIDLSPSVGVSHQAEASWQDPQGTTHEYESDTEVVFTADVSATLDAAGSLTPSSTDEG